MYQILAQTWNALSIEPISSPNSWSGLTKWSRTGKQTRLYQFICHQQRQAKVPTGLVCKNVYLWKLPVAHMTKFKANLISWLVWIIWWDTWEIVRARSLLFLFGFSDVWWFYCDFPAIFPCGLPSVPGFRQSIAISHSLVDCGTEICSTVLPLMYYDCCVRKSLKFTYILNFRHPST